MFTNQDLRKMFVPLFIEQFLIMLVGLADTFIISSVGEAAVSGVSLVNQFNNIFIYLFTALASGGAVIVSQYIGSKNKENSIQSANQLLLFSIVFSIMISFIVLVFSKPLLAALFGKVEVDVMNACLTYLKISAFSYIGLAIYNAGASLHRSMSKTKVTMKISFYANIINVIGNCIGVYLLHAGVAGVAIPSLISRIFQAIVITKLCLNKENAVYYDLKTLFKFDFTMLKRILGIAIPSSIESGIFQFTKVALSSVVALFGTYQIAANGVAQSIWSLAALSGVAMAPIYITVIGQCMGANDLQQTKYYFKKITKLNLMISIVWNIIILAITPLLLQFYNLTAETKHLIFILVIIHNVGNALVYPFSIPLSNGLRATGDVKYTMYVTIFATIVGRLIFSYVLALYMNLGVIGIALAMVLDWFIRAVLFVLRVKSLKWTKFKLIQ